MSKIIQCINDPNPVVVRVTVNTGAAIWKYDYVDRGTTFSGTNNDGLPHFHALGFPHELNMVSDAWSFLLINQSDTDMGYRVTLQWFQGATKIDEWVDEGNIPASDSHRPFDSCTFLEDRTPAN